MTLGQRIREARKQRGLTLASLGSSAQVSVSYLNDIEHDRTVPTLGRLVAIADALGSDVRSLLEGVRPYDGLRSREGPLAPRSQPGPRLREPERHEAEQA